MKRLLTALDYRLIVLLNMWGQGAKFRFFMQRMTRLGGATFTIGMVAAAIGIGNREWQQAGYTAAVGLTLGTVISQILKKFTKRFRPYIRFSDVILIGKPQIDHSFPSGHTTAIFSVATSFAIFFPALSLLFFCIAILVGISRIVLGVHYPTDVGAGIALGILASVLSHVLLGYMVNQGLLLI